jgi:hypothetical protein
MKNIKRLAAAAVLGLTACGLAIAHVHQNGINGHEAAGHGDPAAMANHLGEIFPQVAAFDTNKNGKLDDAEKRSRESYCGRQSETFGSHIAARRETDSGHDAQAYRRNVRSRLHVRSAMSRGLLRDVEQALKFR